MTTADLITESPREAAPPLSIASESLKIPIDRFKAIMNWAAAQPGIAPDLANALRASAWLVEVDAFRDLEASFMVEGRYEGTLADHRVLLSELIAVGEGVLWAARKTGLASAYVKFGVEDLRATLESLHTTFRCEHGPKNSQETNDQIARLFDVSQP